MASYAIEGGGSRNYIHTKQMMHGELKVWHGLMEKFSKVLTSYLRRQIEAGAQAVQPLTAGSMPPRRAIMSSTSSRTSVRLLRV
ncbi:MAG: uroporphyrinogen decarboxylase family protein [Nitrospiraceae bacterium]